MILTAPMYTVYGHESQEDKAKEIIVISHKKRPSGIESDTSHTFGIWSVIGERCIRKSVTLY